MTVLLCPPTFTGFMTAMFERYYTCKDARFAPADTPRTLIDNYVEVAEDAAKARRVTGALVDKGGKALYHDIRDAHRSGKPDKEQIIADYLILFFKRGRAVQSMYGDSTVVAFNDILRKVHFETHRLAAFIRFQETEQGFYYGYFHSDNDILELLLPGFAARFNDQLFVLHDYKRGKMGCYDGITTAILPAASGIDITLSPRETVFKTLWHDYHKNVSISGRENPRLQRGFLPKKYRGFMNEFD